jgi:hypothetical protein
LTASLSDFLQAKAAIKGIAAEKEKRENQRVEDRCACEETIKKRGAKTADCQNF